jgi:hypothetical protein
MKKNVFLKEIRAVELQRVVLVLHVRCSITGRFSIL